LKDEYGAVFIKDIISESFFTEKKILKNIF